MKFALSVWRGRRRYLQNNKGLIRMTKCNSLFAAILCCLSSIVSAELSSRLAGQASFDTLLGITWGNDANLAASKSFGVSGIAADGSMDFAAANDWITALNGAYYLGYSDWQLPDTLPVDSAALDLAPSVDGSTDIGFNISLPGSAYPGSTASQMAHLHYSSLSNQGALDVSGAGSGCTGPLFCLSNNGPLSNLQAFYYWSGEVDPTDATRQFFFHFASGFQATELNTHSYFVMAIRNGDISDQDSDGISDPRELLLGTDANNSDTDGDGISDYDEVTRDNNSDNYSIGIDYDPLLADTDGDGFEDGYEVAAESDPLDPGSQPALGDINNDGTIDIADILLVTRISTGDLAATVGESTRADIAPVVGGISVPDGVVDAADVLIITRFSTGQ
ncbi:MAG TPA: DUF1566 domain-containing protein [Chromatiaceae bacterium]|jgi:hypothetical protein|nr:DUF1566 domain-containing protein [Chromatiaceae bacterium]HIA08928.1 DUF1566 domain-containing protein [Chromatiaceae bacterium]